MTETNVNWLLVGAGAIAEKRVASALAGAREGGLVGVCDVVKANAEKIAGRHGASEVYADIDEALAKTTANAVYVATPVFLHVSHAIQALRAGKHVLVEKPLGVSGADADRLVDAAAGSNLRAGCAYYRRCYPCYAHARQMLADGRLGQIVLIRLTYFSWPNCPPGDWRTIPSKSGGGPLSDMGSHMFDVMTGLLGLPRTVYAKTKTLVRPYEVEDAAAVLMEMDGGAYAVAGFNWNSKTWSHEFEIVGTEAKIKWHPYDSGKVLQTVGREEKLLDLPNAPNVHAPLVRDFVEAVLAGREPAVPPAEAAKTNRLLDAVYRSAETGQEITL